MIFENDDFAVINKPAGLMVHAVRRKEEGNKGRRKGEGKKRKQEREKKENEEKASGIFRRREPTLTDWIVKRWPAIGAVGDDPVLRPGIVHRLDKDTSGVMVVAKTQASFAALKSLFQSREMKKTYVALVNGIPKESEGIIDRPIGIRNGTLKRSVHAKTMAKEAITEYRVRERFPGCALLEVYPKTGRTHQIRVHLASIGHPIVGDRLYGRLHSGDIAVPPAPRLMLHAKALEFSNEMGARFSFEAPLPEDFRLVIHRVMAGRIGI